MLFSHAEVLRNVEPNNTFPTSHPPSPTAQRKRRKGGGVKKTSMIFLILKKQERFAHPLTWDSSWPVEAMLKGYGSLGMFNIKQAIRTEHEQWELRQETRRVTLSCPRGTKEETIGIWRIATVKVKGSLSAFRRNHRRTENSGTVTERGMGLIFNTCGLRVNYYITIN